MKKLLIPLFLAALAVVVAWAESESYERLGPSSLNDYRGSISTPLDGADSLDWSSPISISPSTTSKSLIETRGNPTVNVGVDLSLEGSTVVVYCGLYKKDSGRNSYTFLGVAGVTTATGGASQRTSGRYSSPVMFFDTASATHVELRKTDPSDSATVSIRPWLSGSDPRGVE